MVSIFCNENVSITGAITSDESEFKYWPGKSHSDYEYPDFIPIYFDSIPDDQRTAALEACGSNARKQCIYDFVLTGDKTLALETEIAFDDLAVVQAITGM